MVVRIRLARLGRKNMPFYKIRVCVDKAPRDGKYIEQLGTYDPLPAKDGVKELRINVDRIKYWMSVGAQPSDIVLKLFARANLLPPAPFREMPFKQLPKKMQKEIKVARVEARK